MFPCCIYIYIYKTHDVNVLRYMLFYCYCMYFRLCRKRKVSEWPIIKWYIIPGACATRNFSVSGGEAYIHIGFIVFNCVYAWACGVYPRIWLCTLRRHPSYHYNILCSHVVYIYIYIKRTTWMSYVICCFIACTFVYVEKERSVSDQ